MNDDQERFIAETGEEAHYWFALSAFTDLSIEHGLDKVLQDMVELRLKRLERING